jgi:hypothetical protein
MNSLGKKRREESAQIGEFSKKYENYCESGEASQ